VALCGDLNIAPEQRDIADPDAWEGSVLFNPDMRAEFRELLSIGLVDTFRLHEAASGYYSWWDYRNRGFERNEGLRIDHILANHALASYCTAARIDREARKGKKTVRPRAGSGCLRLIRIDTYVGYVPYVEGGPDAGLHAMGQLLERVPARSGVA
jgi:exodeoxyribonuclease-3